MNTLDLEVERKLNQLLAQQIVIIKRIEKIEVKIGMSGSRLASTSIYVQELQRDARRIVDQISEW